MSMKVVPRRFSFKAIAGAVIAGLVIGSVMAWALSTVFAKPESGLESKSYTYVEAVDGEVGSALNLNVVAEWTSEPVGVNQASGTVTTVDVSQGQEVAAGAKLYSVDLRPVSIARGTVPSFRDLSLTATGADVVQVQDFLHELGLFKRTSDGKFGASTVAAVRAWQKSIGTEQTGTILKGDLVFVPSLPARTALDTDVVKRGGSVSGGEAVVSALPAAPAFTLPVSDGQAQLMPAGTRVEISSPDGNEWQSRVEKEVRNEQGEVSLLLGAGESSVCADQCGSVPVSGRTTLRASVITVETVAGVTLPTAALLSDADGSLTVIDTAGGRWPVTVRANARGMSVVDGLDAGTKVRIPAVAK